jgi:hypothetical protein
MEVRGRDLEAVATRVPGVRYVDSVRLAVATPGGATLTDVEQVPIAGLQLPRLMGIGVREGSAEDPSALLGQPLTTVKVGDTDVPATSMVPVPVLPKKC